MFVILTICHSHGPVAPSRCTSLLAIMLLGRKISIVRIWEGATNIPLVLGGLPAVLRRVLCVLCQCAPPGSRDHAPATPPAGPRGTSFFPQRCHPLVKPRVSLCPAVVIAAGGVLLTICPRLMALESGVWQLKPSMSPVSLINLYCELVLGTRAKRAR